MWDESGNASFLSTLATPRKRQPRVPKTPKSLGKCRSKSAPGTPLDRYIPDISSMTDDMLYYSLNDTEDSVLNPENESIQELYNSSLGVEKENRKILKYTESIPKNAGYVNSNKVLFDCSSQKFANSSRHIPSKADKILDCPQISNDFYINILDWSSENLLAIALHKGVYVWNASTGKVSELMMLSEGNLTVSSLCWYSDYLAIGKSSGVIEIWDVSQGKRLRAMTGHNARVGSLSWLENDLLSGCRSGAIHQHDVRSPEHFSFVYESHQKEVCGLAWSPTHTHFASGGSDHTAIVWQPTMTQKLYNLAGHNATVKAVSWCPWQKNVLATGTGLADRLVRFWNVSSGRCFSSFDSGAQVSGIVWCPHYKEVATAHGFQKFQLSLWKYPSFEKVIDLKGHSSRILHVAISPDAQTVATASDDETLMIWNCFAKDDSSKKAAKSKSNFKFAPIR